MRSLLLAAVLLPASVRAQAPCGAPGVDLAIELGSVQNFAAVGGVDALGALLAPVNVGSSAAPYDFASANHPVFALALHKLTTVGGVTTLEQLGASWVRHVTIPPLSQGLFCACSPGPAGTLGAGCNDTLSASTSALPSNLAARHSVNPSTGAFAFPYSPAPSSGAHPGRLQFDPARVTTGAGERYVLEAQLVSAADAAAGASANDATWVELSAASTGAEATFTAFGPTHRGETVLDAWRSFDPAVHVAAWDSFNEGQVQVAWRVAQTGPATWNYLYAVHGRDYAPGVRRVALLAPASASVSNLGFRDVHYHDGDGVSGANQSGVDWSASWSFGSLAWETSTFAQDPSANALRWGTVYTFQFDCDRPPMPGYFELEPFEPPLGAIGVAFTAEVPLDMDVLASGFCFGDGAGTPCPCGNHSPVGHGEGCLNSLGTGGGLRTDGWSSLTHDTLRLVGTQMPNSTALYLQGSLMVAGFYGTPLGDGLMCLGGTILRLGTAVNTSNASQYPDVGQVAVSVRGGAVVGTSYAYQVWYRNAAAFCTSSTFNLSNGVRLTWAP